MTDLGTFGFKRHWLLLTTQLNFRRDRLTQADYDFFEIAPLSSGKMNCDRQRLSRPTVKVVQDRGLKELHSQVTAAELALRGL